MLENHCVFGRWPGAPRDVSLERLLEGLSRLGFEKGLAVSLRGAFYDHKEGNAETLEACAAHDQLEPAATVNPKSYHSRESLPGELAERGFRMLRLFPHKQGWSPQNVLFERILRECTEVGLPVAFPIGKFPDLASQLARMVPEGCRLILSDVYYNALTECVEVMRRRGEFLMEMGHTCVPGSVEFLCREFDTGRLLLGTGQPLESSLGAIEAIKRAEISEEQQAAILGGTLSALLGGI